MYYTLYLCSAAAALPTTFGPQIPDIEKRGTGHRTSLYQPFRTLYERNSPAFINSHIRFSNSRTNQPSQSPPTSALANFEISHPDIGFDFQVMCEGFSKEHCRLIEYI